MRAKLFTIHTRDLIKGLIMATITAALTLLVSELQAGNAIDNALLKKMGLTAAITFLGYIIKNFLTNSNDEFVTPEPKK